jgi:hypothetical protein
LKIIKSSRHKPLSDEAMAFSFYLSSLDFLPIKPLALPFGGNSPTAPRLSTATVLQFTGSLRIASR